MADVIQTRRGTTAEWAAANPILAVGEYGYNTTTGQEKVGDGTSRWNDLPYTAPTLVHNHSAAEITSGTLAPDRLPAKVKSLNDVTTPSRISPLVMNASGNVVNGSGSVKVNVRAFGAVSDGVTDDSVAVQAAIDSIKNTTGGTIVFPTGTTLFNAVADGTYHIDFEGEGQRTVIESFNTTDWCVKFERNFRTCELRNLSVRGAGNTKLGVYVNTGSYFHMDGVEIYDCLVGLCLNATIDTKFPRCVVHGNFVGIYYTCRTTASGLTFTVNGQTVTVTDAFFPSQPGETTLSAVSVNVNTFGIIMDQPGNPFQPNSDFKWFGGLCQGNKVGILFKQIGLTGLDFTNQLQGVWCEANGTASAVFDGVTYAGSAIHQTRGVTSVVGGSLDGVILKDNAIMFCDGVSISDSSPFTLDANCSLIGKNWQASRTSQLEGYSKDIISYTSSSFITNIKATGSNAFTPAYVNPFFHASTLSWFGAGSASNVADGVLNKLECKEVTLTTVGNGLIITTGPVAAAKSWNVMIFAVKRVSGQNSIFIGATDANTPFAQRTIPITSEWQMHCIIDNKYAGHAAGGANFFTLSTSGDTVFRLSALAFLQFGRYSDVVRFLDSNVYPMVY